MQIRKDKQSVNGTIYIKDEGGHKLNVSEYVEDRWKIYFYEFWNMENSRYFEDTAPTDLLNMVIDKE